MNIQSYIQSGIVEAYALGLVTPVEKQEFEELLHLNPALQEALNSFESQVEKLAEQHAVPPPDETRRQFEDFLKGLPVQKKAPHRIPHDTNGNGNGHAKTNYIVAHEVSSTHIKVHKYWRVAFIAVFILAKIFLGFFIYYMIKFYDARSEIKVLQQQVQTQKH